MGMPARSTWEAQPPRRSHLRIVDTPPARPARASRARERAALRAEEARAKAIFMAFATVLVFSVVLGGVRVALVAQAAVSTLSEGRVQADIRTQRAVSDQLEVDKSSLSTPSRIAGIASTSMKMAEPKSVSYITMPAVRSDAASAKTSGGVLAQVFGAVMDLSAGEAQSLLVGDLGLAGSR